MTSKQSPNENPKDAATSKGQMSETMESLGTMIQYHVQKRNAKADLNNRRQMAGDVILSDTVSRIVWAQRHRDDLLCFSQSIFSGKTYFELRRYVQNDGKWIPTRKGCTIPIESLQGLLDALSAFAAGDRPKPANDTENGLESA